MTEIENFVKKISPKIQKEKWGEREGNFSKPNFSRFKLFCQYYNGNANYYSYDYHYEYPNGIKTKRYNEMMGLYNMVERMMRKDANTYRYMTMFANITNDLSTDKKNYNFYIGKIVRGRLTWTQALRWLDNGRKLDTTGYTCRDKDIPIIKKQFHDKD